MNLGRLKLPLWLKTLVGSLGGIGIFVVAFLDSSVLTFPVINDLLVIYYSMRFPERMPYYAAMATLGSVGGSIVLYFLARKGGEVMFRRRAGARAKAVRAWFHRNSFLAVAVPAMLPPPMPFKLFVLAAAVFQVRLAIFTAALTATRGFRYFTVGYLAVRYGEAATRYITDHKLPFAALVAVFLLLSYLASRIVFPPEKEAK